MEEVRRKLPLWRNSVWTRSIKRTMHDKEGRGRGRVGKGDRRIGGEEEREEEIGTEVDRKREEKV